ncbi:hypothetical protein YC2023_039136 [Brassica napus]
MDNNISVPHDLPEGTISALLQKQNNVVQPSIIIVIGNCISGLAAARDLFGASFKVTVLESRDRIGAASIVVRLLILSETLIRLHGVSNDNPLAPIIRRLGLSLYHTSGDDSFLYDHDLQR